MRYDFEKVSTTARATDRCPACGKKTTRSKEFWQTVSPFNRNPDGTMKTADDIRRDLNAEVLAWEPDHRHAKCTAYEAAQ